MPSNPREHQKSDKTKIYVAGSRGMVGSAIVRVLQEQASQSGNNITLLTRSHSELDLCNQAAVNAFFYKEKPDQVYLAAAKVGGIFANNIYPADFIYQNLMIEANVIHAAFIHGVKKLLFLGSSCIYPREATQPIHESALLSGYLEPTNEPYAVAKIAGVKLCESYNRQYSDSHGIDYRSVMPTNLYGPGDNYHPENSHVIPGLIRRFHEAKVKGEPKVLVWGSGKPRREFLYVDDMARASVHVMSLAASQYRAHTQAMCSHINVGYGEDISIAELARVIQAVVRYEGLIQFDLDKPDGSPRKLMSSETLRQLGWQPEVSLQEGLARAYQEFLGQMI